MNPLFSESVHAELAYLRQLLDEYAAGHRKVANRLRYQGNDASNALCRTVGFERRGRIEEEYRGVNMTLNVWTYALG